MLRGAFSLFAGSLFGKLLGVFREGLLAYLYGTSDVAAASRMSQTAVLSPMNLATSDALSGAFLPQLARLQQRDERGAFVLYRAVRTFLVLFGLAFIVISMLWGDRAISILAPELGQGFIELTVAMTIAMACGAPFYLYVNIAGYLAMSKSDYRISSVRATGQSLGLVLGIAAGYLLDRPALLAWGFTVAYFLMSFWAGLRIRRRGYLLREESARFQWRETWPVLRPFVKSAKILIWMPLFSQAVIVSEKLVAADISVDAVAAVDYARIISDTGVLLLAMPIGLASLPTFAVLSEVEFRAKLTGLVVPLLAVATLCSGLLFILSHVVVQALFGRGAFDANSIDITGGIVQGLSLGLTALLLSYVFTKVLNARGKNVSAICSVGIGAFVTILSRPFLVDVQGVAGLGTSVSVGAVLGVLAAATFLGVLKSLARGLLALTPSIAVVILAGLERPASTWGTIGWAFALVVVWILNVLATRELREAIARQISKRRRASVGGRHSIQRQLKG